MGFMSVPCRIVSQVTFQANHTSGCTPLGVVISVTSPASGSINSYAWTITTPSGTTLNASSASYTAIFSQPGTYDVSLTVNGNQTQTILDYITVNALPTANFTADDVVGCFPHCVNFTDTSVPGSAPITTWNWDFGNGSSSPQQNPENCYGQVGTFTPVFSVSDANGCFSVKTIPGLVSVQNNFPTANFTRSSQLDCNPPVAITMTNISTGNSALMSTWDFGDGQTQTVNGTEQVVHTYQNVGNYNVCVTVENEIGCERQKCLPLTIFETAQAQFTVSETEQCEGEPFIFTSTTTPTPVSFQWDFNGDGVTDNTTASPTYSFQTAGTYSPSLKVVYSTNCSDTEQGSVTLNVIDGIEAAFSTQDTSSCMLPYTANFINQTTGPGILSYQWYINNIQVSTTANLQYTFNSYGVYNVKLFVTSSSGCTAQLIKDDLIVVEEPMVFFENAISVCTDQPVPVFNVTVNSVEPVVFYFWDFTGDGVTDAEGLTPNYTYSAPGIYNITLTIETESGCVVSRTNDQEINVLEEVQSNLSTSTNITCAGEPVTFCIDQQPGNTYSWNFYDGSGWVVMDLNEVCINHDYADTGYFDLSLTVFNGACNVLQTFEDFIYVSPPVAMFEHMVDCNNMSVQLNNISIEADYVTWDFGDGTPLVSGDDSPSHIYTTPGEYDITITAYNDEIGCPDTQTATITVAEPNPGLTFSPTTGCPPLHVGMTPNSLNRVWSIAVSNGDVINASWSVTFNQWQVSHTHNNQTTTYASPGIDSDFLPEIIIEEQGYFDVTVNVVDVNGCTASITYEDVIHVATNPNFASFAETTIDLCNTVSIQYTPDLQDLATWQWTFSDGTTSTEENPLHNFSPPYNYSQPLSATLTATDAQGCESTVTQVLNVLLPPTPNFTTSSATHCINDAVAFVNTSTAPAGTTYSWNFGDGQTQQSQNATHAYAANGNYQVCLTATSPSGCAKTKCTTNPVKVLNPVPAFTHTSSVNSCLFGVQFNNTTAGTSSTTHWDFGDEQAGSGNIVYHTYAIGVYDVTLTVTNQHGCTASTTVPDILNYGNQIGPFSQELEETNCAPFDITLSAFNINDTYFDYFWDFNDGTGDPSGSTVTSHTYLEPGTYCPSVIMTDPNGCPKLISCTEPIVVEEFIMNYAAPEFICFGDTISFTAENADSYQWNPGASVTQGNAPNHFYLHPNDDETLYLTGHLADCIRTDAIHIEVKDLPTVTISLPIEVCFGDEVIELNTGLPNNPIGHYTINNVVATSFNPSSTANQSYAVRYHYTDEFQCSNTATQNVFIHALPVITYPNYSDLCENNAVLQLNQASPAGGIYTLENDTITQFDPSIGFDDYQLTYTYTDLHQCSNSATAQLTVRAAPQISLLFDNTCLNVPFQVENQTFIPDGTSIATSQWTFESAGSSSQLNHAPVTFAVHGEYDFSYRAISEYGCVSFVDTSVRIYAVPQLTFTPNHTCQYEETTFFDLSTIAEGSITSRIWQAETHVFFTGTEDTLSYAFVGYDNQPVTLIATSDFGCSDTLTRQIQVRAAPVVTIEYDSGCIGTETNFTANASIPLGGIVTREWSFGDGHPNEHGFEADNLYDAPGNYTVTFTAVSNLGCTTITEEEITIYQLPDVDFELEYDEVCAGSPFSFYDLSGTSDGTNIVEWTWWMDNHPVSTSQNPTLRTLQAGTYHVTLTVVSDQGCVNDSTSLLAISVWPRPDAGFVTEDEINMANPVLNIYNTSSEDVTEWHYEFGDGKFAVFEEGTHLYENWGVYYVTQYVTNTFGCKDTAIKQITVNPDLMFYIPNAFTPEGNGHNEIFIPVITGSEIVFYDFKIFDRWGQIIFRSNDSTLGWDGSINGIEAQDGVYNWTIEMRNILTDDTQRKQGSVTLIR